MHIYLTLEIHYGVDRYYPIGETEQAIKTITQKKTLNKDEIQAFTDLGHKVFVIFKGVEIPFAKFIN